MEISFHRQANRLPHLLRQTIDPARWGRRFGFACRSHGLNQWSASKLNKFPKTVMHPVRIFVEIFRLAKPQTETKVDEGEERRDFDPLAGSELPEGIEEINKFRPLMEDVRYVLLKRYPISAWA